MREKRVIILPMWYQLTVEYLVFKSTESNTSERVTTRQPNVGDFDNVHGPFCNPTVELFAIPHHHIFLFPF